MSGAEFTEWVVFFARERLMPGHTQARHADMLAALFNGPVQKRGSTKLWQAEDLFGPDPWAPPPAKATRAEISAQIRAMNAARRRVSTH